MRAFVAIDHPGRTFIALAVFFRHVGLIEDELSPRLRELASTRMLDRARVLGAAMRVAYLVSASTTGVLAEDADDGREAGAWCCASTTASRRSPVTGYSHACASSRA